MKKLRVQASKELLAHSRTPNFNKEEIAQTVEAALYAAKIIAYSQGWSLLKSASDEWNWKLHLGELARIWLGGCIIRAKFLERIHHAYSINEDLEHLLFDPELQKSVTSRIPALRTLVSLGAEHGVPMLAMASALSYYDSFRSDILPQNLTQAQRDLFGGHTFERIDQAGSFHSVW